jgi:hypothetical protein
VTWEARLDALLLPDIEGVAAPAAEVGRVGERERQVVLDTDDEQASAQLGYAVVGGEEDRRPEHVAEVFEVGDDLALGPAVLLVGEALVREAGDVL